MREVGKNGGPAVKKYQSATWLKPGPWPYCAAFVCWAYREAALESFEGLLATRPQSPRAFDFEEWGRRHGRLSHDPRKVRQGDVVVFNFSHVGVAVEAYSPLLGISCVEANTDRMGSREGEGVWFKIRPVSAVRSIVKIYESFTPQTA